LNEFDMDGKFKSTLHRYDAITVDNYLAVEEVKQYNKNTLAIDGITPFGKNQKSVSDECTLIWIGSESTAMYVKPYIGILEKLLEKFKNFKIILLGVNRSHIGINSDKVEYIHNYNSDDIVKFCELSDLGFYPVFDNQLGLHRGAHKLNIYFNCLIPAVAFSNEITSQSINGKNGFLFQNVFEFEKNLEVFISQDRVRTDLKQFVLENYKGDQKNLESTKKMLSFFNEIMEINTLSSNENN
jgi:hypothetical protein